MKLALLVCLGTLLQFALTKRVRVGKHLAFDDQQDPHLWQKSGKFQGDILLTPQQAKQLFSHNAKRNGATDPRLRWPKRVIPYVISDDFTARQKSYIDQVVKEDYARTCIRVVPRTNETDYVLVTGKNSGCFSHIGRIGGKQPLNLQPNGCLVYSLISHEFMHAAGFYHQHSASDRDKFVTIQWENIQDGYAYTFQTQGSSNFGQPYDYDSVMQYDAYAFSKNGKKTIIPKQNVKIGTAQKLSPIDIAKINKMYGC